MKLAAVNLLPSHDFHNELTHSVLLGEAFWWSVVNDQWSVVGGSWFVVAGQWIYFTLSVFICNFIVFHYV